MARNIYKIACVGLAFMALSAAYNSFLTMSQLIEMSRFNGFMSWGFAASNALMATGYFFTMLALAYFTPIAMRRLFPEVN